MKNSLNKIDISVIIFFIIISFYSFIKGGSYSSSILILVVLLSAYSIINIIKKKFLIKNPFSKKKFFGVLFLTYCLVFIFGFLRLIGKSDFNQLETFGKISLFTAIMALTLSIYIKNLVNPEKIIFSIVIGICIINLINILAISLNLNNQSIINSYNREIESIFSPTGYRVLFPFVDSGQFYSFVAGIGIIGSIFIWNNNDNSKTKIAILATILSGFFIILGHGSRMALFLLIPVTLLGIETMWRKLKIVLPHILVVILLILPFAIYFNIAGIIIQSLTEFFGIEVSKYDDDLLTFSNRDKIFGSVISELNSMGLYNLIFGYGSYGQKISGVSNEYAQFFSYSYNDLDIIPLHNSLMQILIDYGLFGITIFLLVIKLSLSKITKQQKAPALMLVYLLLGSITEANLTYYSILTFFIFLLLLLVINSNKPLETGKAYHAKVNIN